jgi:hypothetical protein
MGTWGTGISSNDVFEDVKYDFFEMYNKGFEVPEITKVLIEENEELINSEEDSNNFWFCLAKSQWECRALEPDVFEKVKDIIESGKDITLWHSLGTEISKRKKVLDNFLAQISVERKTARKRKVIKLRDAIFEKGDCLVFQLADGDYCGIFILESEKNTEYGWNLICATDIKKKERPTLLDFQNADVLFKKEQEHGNIFKPVKSISWLYAQHIKKTTVTFEKVSEIHFTKEFSVENDFRRFSNWSSLKSSQDYFYEHFEEMSSNEKLKLSDLLQ